jgi:hypothetical protein
MKAVESNVVALPTSPHRVKLECAPYLYPPVLIPPGEFELAYVGHRIERQYRRGVLTAYFVVVDFLPEITVLPRYYPIEITDGKSWRAKRSSALAKEFRRLFRRVPRLDRIPVSWLGEHHVIGNVETVAKDFEQRDLDDAAYSKVGRLERCI